MYNLKQNKMKLKSRKFQNVRENLVNNFSLKVVNLEKRKLSERQLEFVRDAHYQLINKFSNQKYILYREAIFNEIVKKYNNSRIQRNKLDRTICMNYKRILQKRMKLNLKIYKYENFLKDNLDMYLAA